MLETCTARTNTCTEGATIVGLLYVRRNCRRLGAFTLHGKGELGRSARVYGKSKIKVLAPSRGQLVGPFTTTQCCQVSHGYGRRQPFGPLLIDSISQVMLHEKMHDISYPWLVDVVRTPIVVDKRSSRMNYGGCDDAVVEAMVGKMSWRELQELRLSQF
ncbi:hypothetical protein VNO78_10890 [Psophocarpus tetragonolobus]|uniref:Uncharacterized protein n=1 Tax=Psophocarpus tetragonolobus TaxID=3891 RepID=A0AAN9XMY2_PSOTE